MATSDKAKNLKHQQTWLAKAGNRATQNNRAKEYYKKNRLKVLQKSKEKRLLKLQKEKVKKSQEV